MAALETPWFLKSKTSDIGRMNQVFEDRLQRSMTEIQLKRRKAIQKIENQIEAIIQEYKNIRSDVDFTTDLDEHGKKVDPEACRSKSTGDVDLILRARHRQRQRRPVSASGIAKPGKKVVVGKKSNKKQGIEAGATVEENTDVGIVNGDKDVKEHIKDRSLGKNKRKHLLKRQSTSENLMLMPQLVKKAEVCEVADVVVVNDHDSELQRVVIKADEALALPDINISEGVARKKKKKPKKKKMAS